MNERVSREGTISQEAEASIWLEAWPREGAEGFALGESMAAERKSNFAPSLCTAAGTGFGKDIEEQGIDLAIIDACFT